MAAEPKDAARGGPTAAPVGPTAPRAYRSGRAEAMTVDHPDVDIARHLVLAREALPPDPRDVAGAVAGRTPLPASPPPAVSAREDLDEGERLDGEPASAPPRRAFRTRAPVAPHGRHPVPEAGVALLALLDELQGELEAGQAQLRRAGAALERAATRLEDRQPRGHATSPDRLVGHSVAIEMAVSGFSRAEVGAVLERQHEVADVPGVLDQVFGPRSGPDTRVPL